MITAFRIHPEIESCIRKQSPEENRLLEESLLREGCRDPLVLWAEENVLVDGHHRKALCDKHGLSFSVVYMSFPDIAAVKRWIKLNQLSRRNLDKSERDNLIRELRTEGYTQQEIAEAVGVSQKTVSNLVSNFTKHHQINSPVSATAEIDRLQKDLDKAVEMATAAEAKAAELYKAREKIRLETEARAKAEKELQTFRAEMQKSQEEEIARRIEELKQTLEPEVREKEVFKPDPETQKELEAAQRKLDEYKEELKKIQQKGQGLSRLEEKKAELEAELKNLRMKARDEKAELTLYEAVDTIERVTFIRDRVHDLCNRNQLTISQLDKTETVLENLSIAIKEALVVVHASRGALTKEGGLKVVE